MTPLTLDLRHYETIVAIVDLGTMTEAARRLSTTQSALSHRLGEAERRLGVRLFDRGANRRLSPTRAGLAAHQAASRALDELARVEQALKAVDHRITATVRIAVGSYDAFGWYPGFVEVVHAADPSIELELVVVGDAPGAALASGAADIVVVPGTPGGVIDLTPLFDDELVLVVAPDHSLAGRSSVEAEELAGETYLTYNAQPSPGFEYDRFIRPAESYPQIVTVVRQTSAIVEMVAAGAGVSILSRWALATAIEAGRVVPIRCGEGLDLVWHCAIRPEEPEAGPVRTVADELHVHLAIWAERARQ